MNLLQKIKGCRTINYTHCYPTQQMIGAKQFYVSAQISIEFCRTNASKGLILDFSPYFHQTTDQEKRRWQKCKSAQARSQFYQQLSKDARLFHQGITFGAMYAYDVYSQETPKPKGVHLKVVEVIVKEYANDEVFAFMVAQALWQFLAFRPAQGHEIVFQTTTETFTYPNNNHLPPWRENLELEKHSQKQAIINEETARDKALAEVRNNLGAGFEKVRVYCKEYEIGWVFTVKPEAEVIQELHLVSGRLSNHPQPSWGGHRNHMLIDRFDGSINHLKFAVSSTYANEEEMLMLALKKYREKKYAN